jgi:hypothetical protein
MNIRELLSCLAFQNCLEGDVGASPVPERISLSLALTKFTYYNLGVTPVNIVWVSDDSIQVLYFYDNWIPSYIVSDWPLLFEKQIESFCYVHNTNTFPSVIDYSQLRLGTSIHLWLR